MKLGAHVLHGRKRPANTRPHDVVIHVLPPFSFAFPFICTFSFSFTFFFLTFQSKHDRALRERRAQAPYFRGMARPARACVASFLSFF
jgi:hypothetical protein